ncbi:glycoside hydrolase family 71 protein [Panus rudis PR-1116 ss-1]|nr:glycoside hydrolase family 71 protein [Panus rudis PR-1116 ss-1]
MYSLRQKAKLVVAHFMVGNTYPYTTEDWREDILLASRYGFDGFALNVGQESWQLDRVADCFIALQDLSLPFEVFLSFDMSSFPSSTHEDAHRLGDYLRHFGRHPNYLRYEGRAVISTFAGESSLFGFGDLDHAWQHVKAVCSNAIKGPVHFIPSFFIDPRRYPSLKCMDGYFHWNGGWPLHLTPASPRHDVHLPKLDSDLPHLHHLGRRTYMAAVSPWFFTHYGTDSWNKNWIYRSDDHLLVRRWEFLLSIAHQVDIVQFVSWNDFGESHYISPVRGAQPNSQGWVDNCPHHAWLSLNALFIHAFKHTGAYTATPEDNGGVFTHLGSKTSEHHECIWMWSRRHSKHAVATNDPVGRPKNWELTDDEFWVVTLTSSPHMSTLNLSTSDSDRSPHVHHIRPSHAFGQSPQWRLSKFSHSMVPGEGMRAELRREGKVIVVCDPSLDSSVPFKVDQDPKIYNFNAFVCSSTSP